MKKKGRKGKKGLKIIISFIVFVFMLTLFSSFVLYLNPITGQGGTDNEQIRHEEEIPDILRQIDTINEENNSGTNMTGNNNITGQDTISTLTGNSMNGENTTGIVLSGNQ